MKRVIITGGNSGIGYQVAKQLAEKGWSVTLFVCRWKEAAEQALWGNASTDRKSTCGLYLGWSIWYEEYQESGREVYPKEETLDILINNAADFDLSVKKPILTKDGLEKQFATNVVAPFTFYLVEGLVGKVRKWSDY